LNCKLVCMMRALCNYVMLVSCLHRWSAASLLVVLMSSWLLMAHTSSAEPYVSTCTAKPLLTILMPTWQLAMVACGGTVPPGLKINPKMANKQKIRGFLQGIILHSHHDY
jgi:hypothetical protein